MAHDKDGGLGENGRKREDGIVKKTDERSKENIVFKKLDCWRRSTQGTERGNLCIRTVLCFC